MAPCSQVAAAALSQGRQLAMDRGEGGETGVVKDACLAGKQITTHQRKKVSLKNTEQMLKVCRFSGTGPGLAR